MIFIRCTIAWAISVAVILALGTPQMGELRRRWAVSQDGDGYVFRATGLRGTTLRVETPTDDTSCAGLLIVATEQDTESEMLGRGFLQVVCGDVAIRLRPQRKTTLVIER